MVCTPALRNVRTLWNYLIQVGNTSADILLREAASSHASGQTSAPSRAVRLLARLQLVAGYVALTVRAMEQLVAKASAYGSCLMRWWAMGPDEAAGARRGPWAAAGARGQGPDEAAAEAVAASRQPRQHLQQQPMAQHPPARAPGPWPLQHPPARAPGPWPLQHPPARVHDGLRLRSATRPGTDGEGC